MNEIKLDPRKLLGFKVVASNDTTMAVHSPKIGAKQCQSVDPSPAVARDVKPGRSET